MDVAKLELKTEWNENPKLDIYYSAQKFLSCVQPQDRLIALLMDLSTSDLTVGDSI